MEEALFGFIAEQGQAELISTVIPGRAPARTRRDQSVITIAQNFR